MSVTSQFAMTVGKVEKKSKIIWQNLTQQEAKKK
jgi:hypothetical protein